MQRAMDLKETSPKGYIYNTTPAPESQGTSQKRRQEDGKNQKTRDAVSP